MFKFLRSKAKIFYWVIAASFILFIFLAWGMDFTGRGGGGRGGSSGVLGSVNGLAITAPQWDSNYQGYLARLRQQNPDRSLTPNQRASAAKQVWDMMVRERIIEAEVQRRGLSVTDEEILDVLKNNPPAELLANYTDENGNLDLGAYMADLSNPGRDWSGVENYLRIQLPRQKLQQMIAASAVVTDLELRQMFQQQQGRAVAEYLGVLYKDLEAPGEPSEEEIQAYYDAHLGSYSRPERARVQVITWPKEPSDNDRAEVRTLAEEIKQEIQSGQMDFTEAASIYSQDGSAQSGGDLGTFDRQRMVAPFTEVAFSLPVGQISDPVETQFGYHLIEVLEQIEEGGQISQVHARHILLKLEPGEETLTGIYTAAEDFLAQTAPEDFAARAEADSLTLLTPDPFSEGRDIPQVRNSLLGSQFAFQADPGSVSSIFDSDEVYYVVRAVERIPAGPAPLEDVRLQVIRKIEDEKKRQLAATKLSPAVGAIQMGKSFAEAAADFGLHYAVSDTFTSTASIPDVGYGTAFTSVAMEVETGSLVPEVEGQLGLFALRTLWKQPFDEAAFAREKDNLRGTLLGQKQRALVEAWFAEQLASADIVDKRNALRGGA